MAKYHLNPFSGEPNVCNATVKACPWGGEENHFLTKEAARAAYEMRMADEAKAELAAAQVERLRVAAEEAKKPDEAFRTYLSAQEAAAVTTDGISCEHCGTQVTAFEASLVLNEMYAVECGRCGEEISLYSIGIEVAPSKDTYAAFDKAAVTELVWYHATPADNWEKNLSEEGTFYAHLGSKQAAFDRQIAELYSHRSKNEQSFFLYEVRVVEDARIADHVEADENQDYGEFHPLDRRLRTKEVEGREAEYDLDVVRYVNKWEDMASISLVASTHKLKLVGKREVTKAEAVATPSLYNISESMAKGFVKLAE